MDVVSFPTLATLFSLGFFSGLNLYAVVFVSGMAIRFHWVTLPSELSSLEIFAHPGIIITAGVLYVAEFFADKIPWFDNVWDVIHTAIRPLAATFLALHVLGDQSPEIRIIAALICGTFALTSHAAKAGTRLSANVLSPVEPFSNVGLSLAEDAVAIGSIFFVYNHPILTLSIVLVFILIILWFAPKLYRAIRKAFRSRPTPSA